MGSRKVEVGDIGYSKSEDLEDVWKLTAAVVLQIGDDERQFEVSKLSDYDNPTAACMQIEVVSFLQDELKMIQAELEAERSRLIALETSKEE